MKWLIIDLNMPLFTNNADF